MPSRSRVHYGATLGLLLALMPLGSCSDTTAPSHISTKTVRIDQPGAFELVDAGEKVEVLVPAPGLSPADLVLRLGAIEATALTATATPAQLRATVEVPGDAPLGSVHILSVTSRRDGAEDLLATAELHVARRALTQAADVGGSDATLTLGALSVTVGAAALVGKGRAELSRYTQTTFPRLQHDEVLGGVYRLHLSHDPEQISAALRLHLALDAGERAALGTDPRERRSISLVVLDGTEGGPDKPGRQVHPARFVEAPDGSASIVADLPPDAFHRSGSSSSTFVFRVERLPLGLERYEVCEKTATGSVVACAGQGAGRLLELSGHAGHHVSVEARYRWTRTPPSWRLPLATYSALTSPFNPRRTVGGRSRKHTGVDLRAPVGTPVVATFDGRATAVLLNPLSGLLSVNLRSNDGQWLVRYLHLDALDGYTSRRRLTAGERLGMRIPQADRFPLRHLGLSGHLRIDRRRGV